MVNSTKLARFEKLSLMSMFPNVRTYTIMINGFSLEGFFDEAKDMLRKMEDNGCMPNNVTYNVFVQEYLRCSKINEMTTFMKEMVRKGFSCDADTTELLVNVIRENPSVLDMIPEFRSEYKSVKFEGITGKKPEMELVKHLLAKSPMLLRMLIQPNIENGSAETRLKVLAEITKFPRASTKAEADYNVDNSRV